MTLESKRKWILPKKIEEKERIVENILKDRNIKDLDTFFSSDAKNIPPFNTLFDSRSASEKIAEHIEKGSKIVIHGDFDADGICASSLLWEFLYRDLAKHLGKKIDVVPYIPSRIDQGYGLTKDSLDDVLSLGANLLISVDCGVRDFELIDEYMEKGLDFVVTDHHQPPSDLPEKLKYPLVHQLYPHHEYAEGEICGTAVAFLLVQNIKKQFGIDADITENTKGLDLVALATVTDMMPLLGANRIFVKLGLKQMRQGERLGLRVLSLRAKLDLQNISSYHLGFVLGPRINAAGRIGSPLDAVKLLVSNDEKLCSQIANDLESLNFDRQRMTTSMLEEAESQIGDEVEDKLIFVMGNDWHEGVIGLVAGKLLEKYHRPVLVATNNNGIVKGSARSISGFNITKALEKFSKYLERYGGHELAAGFTLKEENVTDFEKAILKYANKEISEEQLLGELRIDAHLESDDINISLIDSLGRLEPFGYSNSKPLIALTDLVVFRKQVMGQDGNHMKLLLKGSGIDLLTATFFNCDEDIEKINENSVVDIAGYPDINTWNGMENVQFNVKEWKFAH